MPGKNARMRFAPALAFASVLLSLSAPPALAEETRTPELFEAWRGARQAEVTAFERFLRAEGLATLAPLDLLLRSASSWDECKSEPYAVPPESHWPAVRQVLQLLRLLRERGVLEAFDVHSSYRDEALNQCSGGAGRSAHRMSYAIDLTPARMPETGDALCRFWRNEGEAWRMGLSRYASGRIHIDTSGYRTWGGDGTSRSSYCLINTSTP